MKAQEDPCYLHMGISDSGSELVGYSLTKICSPNSLDGIGVLPELQFLPSKYLHLLSENERSDPVPEI